MKSAREWANDRQLAYDVSDLESEKFYAEIQKDAQVELRDALQSMLVVFESLKAGEQEWGHYEEDAINARALLKKERH